MASCGVRWHLRNCSPAVAATVVLTSMIGALPRSGQGEERLAFRAPDAYVQRGKDLYVLSGGAFCRVNLESTKWSTLTTAFSPRNLVLYEHIAYPPRGERTFLLSEQGGRLRVTWGNLRDSSLTLCEPGDSTHSLAGAEGTSLHVVEGLAALNTGECVVFFSDETQSRNSALHGLRLRLVESGFESSAISGKGAPAACSDRYIWSDGVSVGYYGHLGVRGNVLGVWSSSTDEWTTQDVKAPRRDFGACAIGSRLVVVGGVWGSGQTWPCEAGLTFDLQSKALTRPDFGVPPRIRPALCSMQPERIVIFGGLERDSQGGLRRLAGGSIHSADGKMEKRLPWNSQLESVPEVRCATWGSRIVVWDSSGRESALKAWVFDFDSEEWGLVAHE